VLPQVSEPRLLIRVSAADLPPCAQALLDPEIPRPADSRFLVRRTYPVWIPLAWLGPLLVVGFASVRETIAAWPDPAGAAIYGALAAICLFFAVISAHRLILGIGERTEVKLDRYRQGLHVLGLQGLLIAGRGGHTWVPRSLLPEPIDVTPRGGGGGVKSYAYVLADGSGRVERLDCGFTTQSTLWLWSEHGYLPDGGGWK